MLDQCSRAPFAWRTKSFDAAIDSAGRARLWASPLALGRSRSPLLNAVQDELVVASLRSIFHAADEPKWGAVAITAIDRALRDAVFPGHHVVADEDLITDDNALGMGLAAARIEALLLSVHETSPLRLRDDAPFRTRDGVCRRTFLSWSAIAPQP